MTTPTGSDETGVRVTVRLRGYLQITDEGAPIELVVPGELKAALQAITQQIPGLEQRIGQGSIIILLNGVNLHGMRGESVSLADGDLLDFVPFAAGG
jgi:molybdopterin converting factor small subunit